MIFDDGERLNMKDSQRSYILHFRHTIHPTVSHAVSHIVSHIVSHVISHIASHIVSHVVSHITSRIIPRCIPRNPTYPILFYPTHPTLSHVLGLVILTESWKILKDQYSTKSDLKTARLMKEFSAASMTAQGTCSEFVKRVRQNLEHVGP